MKKEDFMKLGLDEETAKKCESASAEELKGFIPKVRFDEVNSEKKKLEADVKERDGQLETLKTSTSDVDGLKEQIATLQKDNKVKEDAHAAEIRKMKVDAAVETALTGAKAINGKAVRPFLADLDKAELLEDGTVKGLGEQIAALAKGEGTKFLFGEGTKPKMRGANGGHSGNEPEDKKVDTSKMTYSQTLAYLAENPDAKI